MARKKLVGMIEKEEVRKIIEAAFQNIRLGTETMPQAKANAIKKIEETQSLYAWQSSTEILPEDTSLPRVEGDRPYIKVLAYADGKHIVLRRINYPKKGIWLWSNGYTADEVKWWCALIRRPSKQMSATVTRDDNGL